MQKFSAVVEILGVSRPNCSGRYDSEKSSLRCIVIKRFVRLTRQNVIKNGSLFRFHSTGCSFPTVVRIGECGCSFVKMTLFTSTASTYPPSDRNTFVRCQSQEGHVS